MKVNVKMSDYQINFGEHQLLLCSIEWCITPLRVLSSALGSEVGEVLIAKMKLDGRAEERPAPLRGTTDSGPTGCLPEPSLARVSAISLPMIPLQGLTCSTPVKIDWRKDAEG